MPDFNYTAINESGQGVSGAVEAKSAAAAREMIGAKGYIPTKISRAKTDIQKGSFADRITTVRTKDLILFTKQFSTMLRAGIPIIDLFKVIEKQTENSKLKLVLMAMGKDIQEGSSLYVSMSRHPKVFSPLFLSMIKAGETSGALPEVLNRLIYIISHEHKVKKDVQGALIYPAIVLVVLTGAFFFLITFVVPKFVTLFAKLTIDLPIPTRICMGLYSFLFEYWIFLLVGTAAGVTGFILYVRTDQGRYVLHKLILAVPIFGVLLIKTSMSRFASIFAILQASGVTVLDSFGILSRTIGNSAISRQFDGIVTKLEQGRGISQPLSQAYYFTPMVVNMVAIGEESGNLEEMLQVISDHYDDEVEYAVAGLSEAILPVLTIGLAGVVLFFALAIFLPMWDLTQAVK